MFLLISLFLIMFPSAFNAVKFSYGLGGNGIDSVEGLTLNGAAKHASIEMQCGKENAMNDMTLLEFSDEDLLSQASFEPASRPCHNESATIKKTQIELTPPKFYKTGSVFRTAPIALTEGFDMHFDLMIADEVQVDGMFERLEDDISIIQLLMHNDDDLRDEVLFASDESDFDFLRVYFQKQSCEIGNHFLDINISDSKDGTLFSERYIVKAIDQLLINVSMTFYSHVNVDLFEDFRMSDESFNSLDAKANLGTLVLQVKNFTPIALIVDFDWLFEEKDVYAGFRADTSGTHYQRQMIKSWQFEENGDSLN